MDKRPSRIPLVLGIVLIGAGWLAIYLAWNQAGRQRLEVGQIPYLLSGGFGGVGLLLLGASSVIVDQLMQTSWRARQALDELKEAMLASSERIENAARRALTERATSHEDEEDEEQRPSRRRRRRTGSA